MKIVLAGYDDGVSAEFVELYKKKYEIVTPARADLLRYENAAQVLREEMPDAVIADCTQSVGAENLIVFKNLQYAATLYGVKKLLVLGGTFDIRADVDGIHLREADVAASEPPAGQALNRMVYTLAAKGTTTVLRLFGVYGKYCRPDRNRLAEILSHAVTGKKEIELPADKTFSALYAEDACKIVALFLERDLPRGTYNVAAPMAATLFEFAKKARSFAKKNEREVVLRLGNGVEHVLSADTTALHDAIGNFKFTALTTGIGKTLEYYASHKSKLKS